MRERERETETETDRDRQRQTDRQRHRESNLVFYAVNLSGCIRARDRQTDRQRQRDRDTERDSEIKNRMEIFYLPLVLCAAGADMLTKAMVPKLR